MKSKHILIVIAVIAALIIAVLNYPIAVVTPTEASAGKSLAIKNVRVFDGAKVTENATVVVTDGKIVAFGKKVKIPKDAEIIDGTGKTLMPGMIDAHVHMADSSAKYGGAVLEQAAVYGVTTVMDLASSNPNDYQAFRKKVKAGEYPQGADIFTAGVGATVRGGHGDMTKENPMITGLDMIPQWMNDRVAGGSDYIKIISETFQEHHRNVPTLTDEEFAAVVAEAHKHKLLAISHTLEQKRATQAVLAGIDGLVHISPYNEPDPNFGKLMAQHHVFQSTNLISYAPTSYKFELAADKELVPFMPKFMIDDLNNAKPFADANPEWSIAALKILKAAKVPILAGTDIGYPYAPLIFAEVEIMVKDGGFTPIEALQTLTSNVVTAYHINDRGWIKPEMRADLLLVNGDPTKDILALRAIDSVWIKGVKIDREAYQKLLPTMKAPPRMGPPSQNNPPPKPSSDDEDDD